MKPLPSKNFTLAELDAYLASRKAREEKKQPETSKTPDWVKYGRYPGFDQNSFDDFFNYSSPNSNSSSIPDPSDPPKPRAPFNFTDPAVLAISVLVFIVFTIIGVPAEVTGIVLLIILVPYGAGKLWSWLKKELIELLKQANTAEKR